MGWVLLTASKENMDEALAEAAQVEQLWQKSDALDVRVQQLEAELQRSLPSELPS